MSYEIELGELPLNRGEEYFYAHMLEDEEKQKIDMRAVKKLLMDGFSERYVRSVLGISDGTWVDLKKEYPRFKQLVDNWVLADKESIAISMKQKAKGFRYTERKKVPRESLNEETGQMETKMVVVEETEKMALPDTAAGKFMLTNLDGETYKEKQVHEVRSVNSYEQDLLAARRRLREASNVEVVEDIEVKKIEKKKKPEPVKKAKPATEVKQIDSIGLEGLL